MASFTAPAVSSILNFPYGQNFSTGTNALSIKVNTFFYKSKFNTASGATVISLTLPVYSSGGGGGGACTGYPLASNVKNSIVYGSSGEYTGTMVLPTAGQVRSGVGFGGSGTEFTGTITLPTAANVRTGVSYGTSGTELTGTLISSTRPSTGMLYPRRDK